MDNTLLSATPAAIAHFQRILKKPENHQKSLRLSLKKSGCSGLSYVMETVDKINDSDLPLALAEDLILYLDLDAKDHVKNMEIDFVKTGLNQQLVFHNPNQTGACGCGESFTVS